MNGQFLAFNGILGCKIRYLFKGLDVFRSAIWIAGIIHMTDSKKNILCLNALSIAKGNGEEYCISCRNRGCRYFMSMFFRILLNLYGLPGQSRVTKHILR